MSTDSKLDRLFARYPALAVLSYVAIVGVLGLTTVVALTDLYDRSQALAAATDMLDQIEGRKVSPGGAAVFAGAPAGSPFLEGQTVTVAGAALQQRVTAAVGKLGGNVLSSQVDLAGTQSKAGFVSLVASCGSSSPPCRSCCTISRPGCRSCSSTSSRSRPHRPAQPRTADECTC